MTYFLSHNYPTLNREKKKKKKEQSNNTLLSKLGKSQDPIMSPFLFPQYPSKQKEEKRAE
jgi:hypothetical protein